MFRSLATSLIWLSEAIISPLLQNGFNISVLNLIFPHIMNWSLDQRSVCLFLKLTLSLWKIRHTHTHKKICVWLTWLLVLDVCTRMVAGTKVRTKRFTCYMHVAGFWFVAVWLRATKKGFWIFTWANLCIGDKLGEQLNISVFKPCH